VQYFTGLPIVLVTLHLLGAGLTVAAMTWLLLGTRQRVAVPAADGARATGSDGSTAGSDGSATGSDGSTAGSDGSTAGSDVSTVSG
jgi:hypothetical protein